MVHDLTRVISDCGGSISESRMASLGNEFAMLVLVSGNWHSLAKLESEEREAIVAHLWGGLSFAEIASLMKSSAATVHRRFWSGIESLRRELEEQCPAKENMTSKSSPGDSPA